MSKKTSVNKVAAVSSMSVTKVKDETPEQAQEKKKSEELKIGDSPDGVKEVSKLMDKV